MSHPPLPTLCASRASLLMPLDLLHMHLNLSLTSRLNLPYSLHPGPYLLIILHLYPSQPLTQSLLFSPRNPATRASMCHAMYRQPLYPVLLPDASCPPEEQLLTQLPLSEDADQVLVVKLELGGLRVRKPEGQEFSGTLDGESGKLGGQKLRLGFTRGAEATPS